MLVERRILAGLRPLQSFTRSWRKFLRDLKRRRPTRAPELAIRAEIRDIEEGRIDADNNPLKHAPHRIEDPVKDWDRPHAQGCFPPGASRVDTYRPPVDRVDNVYGDRHLVCTGPPLEDYAEAAE